MKILKMLMERKGMEIPDKPVVYVLCREEGSYSDYSMSVEEVFVDGKEAKQVAKECNSYIAKAKKNEEKFQGMKEVRLAFEQKHPKPSLIGDIDYLGDYIEYTVHKVKIR